MITKKNLFNAFIASLCLISPLSILLLSTTHYVNVPYCDEWQMTVPLSHAFLNHSPYLQTLWTSHGEQCSFLANTIVFLPTLIYP
jgi:hypothetical protein